MPQRVSSGLTKTTIQRSIETTASRLPVRNLRFYQSLLNHAMGVSRPGTRLLDVGCAFGDCLRNTPRQLDLVGVEVNRRLNVT
jgi:hypothetical protein